MIRSAVSQTALPRRIPLIAALLAAITAAGAPLHASGAADDLTVEPRIVEARLGRVSLEQIDVSLRVALRASQAATIRSIAFTDAFIGQVPVWVERVQGDWPLEPGRELVIPEPVQVRIHARDAVGADDLGSIVRKGAVTVRASVEVAIETPWLARLMFMGPTRILVRDVVLDLPIQAGPSYLGPLARIGADLADAAQRGAATWLESGLNHLPARSAMVHRYGGAVAGVITRYAVEGSGPRDARERRAAGVWWNPGVFCTTREAIEPWRFDVADATALQLGGARLRRDRGAVHVAATADRPALDIDLAVLDQILPAPRERKLYALVDGRTRRLRLGDRDAATNLVCLQVGDGAAAPTTAVDLSSAGRSVVATGTAADDVAAFSPGRSLGVVWTSVTPAGNDRLQIATPLHRLSFGSPLVSADRVVGLVASPTTAWPASLVAIAAGRAPRLPSTRPSTASASSRPRHRTAEAGTISRSCWVSRSPRLPRDGPCGPRADLGAGRVLALR
jgi:hypothetical protein